MTKRAQWLETIRGEVAWRPMSRSRLTTRTRMNVYFDPELLAEVEALALRRQVSKSAIVEAADRLRALTSVSEDA